MSSHRPQPLVVGFLAVVGFVGGASSVGAEAPNVELGEKKLRLEAELHVLKEEKACLDRAAARQEGVNATSLRLTSDSQILRVVKAQLTTSHRERGDALRKLADDSTSECNAALEAWRQAHEAARRARQRLADAAAAPANTNASIWDLQLILIVAGGGLIVLVAVALSLHVRRVGFREWCRAWAVLLTFLLAGVGSLAAAPSDDKRERENLLQEIGELEVKKSSLSSVVEQKRRSHLARWEALLLAVGERDRAGLAGDFAAWEEEDYKNLHTALVNARIVELAEKDGKQLLEAARQNRDEAEKLDSRAGSTDLTRRLVKFGAAAGLPLLALLLLGWNLWITRRRRRAQGKQCPCCFHDSTLEPKATANASASSRILECRECHHEVPNLYRWRTRLCFPTVGVPASGKTHWLVTVYDQVAQHQFPALEKVHSPANAKFDELVRHVLRSRRRLQATPFKLTWPLALNFLDSDPAGRNAALLNLFDFGGELMNYSVDLHHLRNHALRQEGFVFFLDPTVVDSTDLDEQMSKLDKFHEDLRITRSITDQNAKIEVPVAVCVTKLDLLPNEKYLGGQILPWLRRLRETADKPLSLDLLEERSKMILDVFPLLFNNRKYPERLKEHFGKRVLFFPVTPVGLEDNHLGEEDLSKCDPSPFGTLEPILWLMHARGYNVLPRSSA